MSTSLPRMSSSPPSSPSYTPLESPTPSLASLPVRQVPGSYGLPLIGPLWDRLDYFWFSGPESFLRKRMDKYKSSVFRTNIPPSFPFFIKTNPKMIAVLDVKAFKSLFDMEVVEKRDVLIGDYMPSTSFTGNMRVGVYLDPSEPKHSQACIISSSIYVKEFCTDILKRGSKQWVPELLTNLDTMWNTIEKEVTEKGSSSIFIPLLKAMFRFLTKAIVGADPLPSLGENAFVSFVLWIALQLLPTQSINILQPLEEIFLHSFSYPSFLVQPGYQKLYNFIKTQGQDVVQRGVSEFGLSEDEAIHNLLFVLGFNAFGGFSVFLPFLLGNLGNDQTGLQARLREEVRSKIDPTQPISFDSVSQLDLVQSFVYESLRFQPPVPAQFARARKDFVLYSHDAGFPIKKGELLFGYQPLAMRDAKVFDEPERFVADRFTEGKGGRGLLEYLYWSNGPQTGSPSSANKQCVAKDHVVFTACVIVADLFRRYDSFGGTVGSITAVEKAK
ncbi:hypothetical protein Sjap_003093 [Stephania japonica]|uniref:Cytochrome P450 n=1 Tax=Stephania japonica TaxID=461633 RepID=A0AAP0KPM3_9MAGN